MPSILRIPFVSSRLIPEKALKRGLIAAQPYSWAHPEKFLLLASNERTRRLRTLCCVLRGNLLRTSLTLSLLTIGFCSSAIAQSATPHREEGLSTAERTMVATIDKESGDSVSLLKTLVNINSGTLNLPGVIAIKDQVQPRLEALGFTTGWHSMQAQVGRAGDLVAEHPCPKGPHRCGKHLLLIDHMDTVFEPTSSFQRFAIVSGTNGRIATGPGAADTKGGLVIMLTALDAMKAAGMLTDSEITIVLDGDEEDLGIPTTISRADLIESGKRADVALEFENTIRVGDSINGSDTVRLGRRSDYGWTVTVTGSTGHSSSIFSQDKGYGAIYELARILDQFRLQLPERGLTYNVGMALGGATANFEANDASGRVTGKHNVIPSEAIATGDMRTLDNDQLARTQAKMRKIVDDHLSKTDSMITFQERYPAMAVTPASKELLRELNQVNAALGLAVEEPADPVLFGAGDIAFVAPFVPGLVSVGALGAGAHGERETVYLDSLPTQTKRMAILMSRLSRPAPPHSTF